MTGSTFITGRPGAAVTTVAAFGAAVVLALAPSGSPQGPASVLSLGPVSIGNGTATLSGSVAGGPSAAYRLEVNGRPLRIDADGTFAGTVDLAGQSVLTVKARNPPPGE